MERGWGEGVRHNFWEIWRGLRAFLRGGVLCNISPCEAHFSAPPPDNYCTVPKGPAKRIQHHPTLLNPTLLDDVARFWTRWPSECNMMDSTLELERSGSKIYPESLESKLAPYWFT